MKPKLMDLIEKLFFFSSFEIKNKINIDLGKWSRIHCACLRVCILKLSMINHDIFAEFKIVFLCYFVVTFFSFIVLAIDSNKMNKCLLTQNQLTFALNRRQKTNAHRSIWLYICLLFYLSYASFLLVHAILFSFESI